MQLKPLGGAIAATWLLASIVAAHVGHEPATFSQGVLHPITGIDHLVAALAVGMLATLRGGSALWVLPLAFLAGMVSGGVMTSFGVAAPAYEWGIVLSVVALGAAIVLVSETRMVSLTLGVAIFALFHGSAHAAEGATQASFAGGLVLSTVLLHAAGIGLVGVMTAMKLPKIERFTGAAVGVSGLALCFGWL